MNMKNYSKWTKEELTEEIEALHKLINKQRDEIGKLRSEDEHVQKLKKELTEKISDAYWAPRRNDRGAGRKSKINKELVTEVKEKKKSGMTFRAIAETLNISLGLAYKAYNSNLFQESK
jgi:hypothetical protein